MLELKHVSYSYQSYQEIFSDVNYQFKNGTFTALLSVSLEQGNQPSSLLLAGLDNPKKGQVLFDGEDIQTKVLTTTKHHVSLVFQNYNLIDYLTPLENVRLVNKQAGKDILLGWGWTKRKSSAMSFQLSGGQQQRVAIARALVSESTCHLSR